MHILHRIHRALSPLIYGTRAALVPSRVNATWPQRQFLRRLLAMLDVDCVFDVGANEGQYGHELRLIGYRGLILSFEPAPDTFAKLERRAATDPQWHVFNCALGAEAGSAPMNEMTTSQYNSFRSPSSAETASHDEYNVVARRITVAVDTLDATLPRLRTEFGFKRPFLKMDTQGFDLEVFRGAGRVAAAIVGLQSEVSFKRIYADTPTWAETVATYEQAGFALVGLHKVNPQHLRLIEADCYMVREDLMPELLAATG